MGSKRACGGQGFTGFAPAFHFLIKLPSLNTPIAFSSNLVKDTVFTKPIFKGRAVVRIFLCSSRHRSIPSSAFVLAQSLPVVFTHHVKI
jgi:hypothetical protein